MAVLCGLCACSFDPHGTEPEELPADASAPIDAPVDARVAAPFCDPTNPDLIACYRFEDPAAPVHDESMYANEGTASAVVSLDGPPGHGQAIGFVPTSVASVPDAPSLNCTTSITMELWVRPHSLPATRSGLLDNDGQYGLFLGPDGSVRCAISSTVPIALSLKLDQWTHVACTYDGQAIRLYQDGKLASTTMTSVVLGTGSMNGMRLGMNSPDNDVLDGAIDDVRLWRVARSDAQICAAADRASCL
jgi:Concanavalin A-like lectin/glucanases superfamily